MRCTLEQQRAAFFAELPVSLAVRQDRLCRAIAMIEQNEDALVAALCQDGQHQDRVAAMRTEITPALDALNNSLKNLESWMQPTQQHGLWGNFLHDRDYTDYQPVGVIGFAAPAAGAILETVTLLATAWAAGNVVMVQFDQMTPHLRRSFATLSRRYFSSLELHVLDGDDDGSDVFAELPFDLFVGDVSADADDGLHHPARSDAVSKRSGQSPVIIGRSADFAKAAEQIIASRLARSGNASVSPGYLLVPAEQEDIFSSWLWRAAMSFATRHADLGLPFSEAAHAQFTRLIDDARARGADIMVVEPPAGDRRTDVRSMPLHILRHATDDMLVMQGELCGPILPLRCYGHIDEAIREIHRHTSPTIIYYFGHDKAERQDILARTTSSAVVLDGNSLARVQSGFLQAEAEWIADRGHGNAAFRNFSRARHVYRRSMIGMA